MAHILIGNTCLHEPPVWTMCIYIQLLFGYIEEGIMMMLVNLGNLSNDSDRLKHGADGIHDQ